MDLNGESKLKCPKCGSENIQIIIERDSNNFDLTSGIIGTICLGPIGLLCGLLCGESIKEKTTCKCNNCGLKYINER